MREIDSIKERYNKRRLNSFSDLYSFLSPAVYMTVHEKERALIRWLERTGWSDVAKRSLLEIGCGSGGNLYSFMRLGFRPENLFGNELLLDRFELAKASLPSSVTLILGDASEIALPSESFDVVFQSTVFTSILNHAFQARLAENMWRLVKPGGGVLWYDFTYDNPRNSDVRGVQLSRIHELFPEGRVYSSRVTLAPPISRRVCKVHPGLYSVFNLCPFLRTHLLCWIYKSK